MEGLNEDPSIQLQLVMVCGYIDRPFGSGVNFVCDCNIMNMKCPSYYIEHSSYNLSQLQICLIDFI